MELNERWHFTRGTYRHDFWAILVVRKMIECVQELIASCFDLLLYLKSSLTPYRKERTAHPTGSIDDNYEQHLSLHLIGPSLSQLLQCL